MDEMFDRAFDSSFMTMKPAPFFSRRAEFPVLQNQALRRPYIYNIAEDEKKFQLSFEVPGVKPSNLSVHLEQDGRILRISGVREVKHGDMSYESNFDKTFALDKSVDVEKITANLSEGIMTIDAPKKAKIESKSIDIPIQVNYPDTQIEFPLERAALDNEPIPHPQLKIRMLTSRPKPTRKKTPLTLTRRRGGLRSHYREEISWSEWYRKLTRTMKLM